MKYHKQSGDAERLTSAETQRGSIIRDSFMMRSFLANGTDERRADSAARLHLDVFSKRMGAKTMMERR